MEFTVNRGGIVSLAPVVDSLKRVERSVDKTASELAIVRLQRDADVLTHQWQEVKAKSYLGLSGWGTILLVLGVSLLLGGQAPLGGMAIMGGILMLVSAFNSSNSKAQKLGEIEQQYAAKVSEIDKHKAIVGQ